MIDTAGTLAQAAGALVKEGATGIWAYATILFFLVPLFSVLPTAPLKRLW